MRVTTLCVDPTKGCHQMLTRLFCEIDDFCQVFLPEWNKTLLTSKGGYRRHPCGLSESEIMMILVHYHQAGYRTFKGYYQRPVAVFLKGYFPQLPSYQRFIELMPRVLLLLTLFMQQCCQTGRGMPSSTLPPSKYVRICAFPIIILFAKTWDGANRQRAGFTASNFTGSWMTAATFCRLPSPPAIRMTKSLSLPC